MHTPRMTHVALHVRNLGACIEFYEDFCGLNIVHRRQGDSTTIVWLAEPGRETDFIFVLMDGGTDLDLRGDDYRHFGFAVDSRDAVDEIARRASALGCLLWPPREDEFPVGYYCGVRDPNGNYVEFSYGQPLGPGAESLHARREIEL